MNIFAHSRFGACVLTLMLAPMLSAQQPAATASSSSSTQSGTTTSTPESATPVDTNASRFPPILSDGGISIQLIGWMVDARPRLAAGASSIDTTFDNTIDLPHESKPIPGVEISVPAGSGNSLRFTYFRLLGQGNTYAPATDTISSVGFNAGDFLNSAYTMQMIKGDWDFLTYTISPNRENVRLKTLWGVQYIKVNSVIDAPGLNYQALAVGNAPQYTALTEKNFVYPSLGIGLEQQRSRFFRWEASVSGFGIPHHPALLDGEVNLVLQEHKFDVLLGAKYFYFKTSPQSDEYFRGPLWGPSIALRWYYIRGSE